MKFYDPKDKKPLFGIKYVLWDEQGFWINGWLKEIKITENGDEFIWKDVENKELMNDITHYMLPEPPKNNQ